MDFNKLWLLSFVYKEGFKVKHCPFRPNYLTLLILTVGWMFSLTNVYACDPNLNCIMVYDPVCGTDGNTYSNSCMAEKACVDVAYPGVCSAPPPTCQDQDNDNFSPDGGNCGPIDCNDQDPFINPDMGCLAVYDPVCGVDGNTYSNSCEALRVCVIVDYPGECKQSPVCTDNDQDGYSPDGNDCGPIDCNDNDPSINPGMFCLDIYEPVCGVDGKTYGNSCVARQACVEIDHEGECTADTPPVARALYSSSLQYLVVIAKSALGQEDQLTVENYGAMTYVDSSDSWILLVSDIAPDQVPDTVTIIGLQGSTTVEVTIN